MTPDHQPSAPAAVPNQFALLRQRRFAPFFWTQFLGAGNDNLFKFAFTVMVSYGAANMQGFGLAPALVVQLIAALFILPFLLFSATSGQLADKYEKSALMRLVKNLEIVIMLLAAWGFVAGNVALLLACTFAMGLHSTLFGPVKFAYLPQHLRANELTGGNGMVEMGTFVSILLGNLAGGLLVGVGTLAPLLVGACCVAVAVLGRIAVQGVPLSPASAPELKINWNPFTETWRNLVLARGNLVVFRCLIGISWLWFFGVTFLTQFPSLARDVLHGNEQVASALLVVFSLGIGIGSLLCESLSRRRVEIGLVPLGAIGMTIFAVDLYFATRGLSAASTGLQSIGDFLTGPQSGPHARVLADLFLLALFAGFYSVPMYALIQARSPESHRARIIAANNILNALFMIVAAGMAAGLLSSGFSVPQVLLVTGLLNIAIIIYLLWLAPEFLLRLVGLLLTRVMYRFRVQNEQRIPAEGACVLVCNHVSFIDPLLLMSASPRPIYFVMDHRIFAMPLLGWLFRAARAIPIAPKSDDPVLLAQAYAQAVQVLKNGDILGIFPEGHITADGELLAFKGGLNRVLEEARAQGVEPPVIPLALNGLWGSFFSRKEAPAMTRPLRRGLWNIVTLNVGEPIHAALTPQDVQPAVLRARVAALLVA